MMWLYTCSYHACSLNPAVNLTEMHVYTSHVNPYVSSNQNDSVIASLAMKITTYNG